MLLGVVQRAERAQLAGGERVVVEQHAGGDERSGEAAAPSLVGAGDEPKTEPAVEREQPFAAVRAAARAPARALKPSAGCSVLGPWRPQHARRTALKMPMRSGGQ